jgi:large subunit ribosomal protein L21
MEVYAIVDVGGRQFKVFPDRVVRIPRIASQVGEAVDLERILLLSDGKNVEIGKPFIEGKKLHAEVIRHGKEKKVIVFKKKRRKNYRRKRGHRQPFTEVLIKDIPG